jgi:hypothetical protein
MHSLLRSRFIASRVNDPLTRVELARYIHGARVTMREVLQQATGEPQPLPASMRGRQGYGNMRLEFKIAMGYKKGL